MPRRMVACTLFAWLILAGSSQADEIKGKVKSTKGSIVGGKMVVNVVILEIDGKPVDFFVDKNTKVFDGKTELKGDALQQFLNRDLLLREAVINFKKDDKKNTATEIKATKKD